VRNEWNDEETRVAEEFLTHALAIRAEREAAAREGASRASSSSCSSGAAPRSPIASAWSTAPRTPSTTRRSKRRSRRHPLRREPHPARGAGGRIRPRARAGRCTAQLADAQGNIRTSDVELPRARSSSPRARSPTPCSRARTPSTSSSTAATSARSTRTASRSRRSARPSRAAVACSCRASSGRFMSFFGDLHPSFFGNVVKAMGSAKQGYPVVSRVLERCPRATPRRTPLPRDAQRRAARHRASRRAPHAQDRRGVVRAPLAARRSSRPVLPPAELRDLAGRPRARRSPWRASRSPARGSIASRASSPRSCSRWAARATCARCSSPASPWC
jgi:hypothetical protein